MAPTDFSIQERIRGLIGMAHDFGDDTGSEMDMSCVATDADADTMIRTFLDNKEGVRNLAEWAVLDSVDKLCLARSLQREVEYAIEDSIAYLGEDPT